MRKFEVLFDYRYAYRSHLLFTSGSNFSMGIKVPMASEQIWGIDEPTFPRITFSPVNSPELIEGFKLKKSTLYIGRITDALLVSKQLLSYGERNKRVICILSDLSVTCNLNADSAKVRGVEGRLTREKTMTTIPSHSSLK